MTGFIVSVFLFRNRVSSKEAFEGLELGEGKLSRPVLRGPGGRKAAWLLGSNRRRQIKEIPWRLPKGSIGLRITGRPAIFLMSGRISFTLFLWVPRMGAPTGDHQADLTIVEPYT
jgi:hypothetical protein